MGGRRGASYNNALSRRDFEIIGEGLEDIDLKKLKQTVDSMERTVNSIARRLNASNARLNEYETNNVAFWSAKVLARTLIDGQCEERDESYLGTSIPPTNDICRLLSFQRYPVSIVANRGLSDEEKGKLRERIEAVGLPTYLADHEATFLTSDNLAVVYPEKTPSYLICALVEAFNELVPEPDKGIRYAVTVERISSEYNEELPLSRGVVLLGERADKFLDNVRPVARSDWGKICSYSPQDFRDYIDQLSENASCRTVSDDCPSSRDKISHE